MTYNRVIIQDIENTRGCARAHISGAPQHRVRPARI